MMYGLDETDLNLPDAGSTSPAEGVDTNTVQPAAAVETTKYKYTANGREVEEDINTILKRASQGYNYAQHMESIKKNETTLAEKEKQIEALRNQWEPYDKYAKENPEWANHVRQSWETRLSGAVNGQEGQPPSSTTYNLPPEVQQKLAELENFQKEYSAHKQSVKAAEEDAALNAEIDSVAKEYPEFDLKYSDPSVGKTLEAQIIEHANIKGIHSFRAAFRDMMFDQIMSKRVTASKEAAAKELQDRAKKGIVKTSDTPFTKQNPMANKSGSKSYYDLVNEAGKELNLF
jgi:hypothetical protein